MNPFTYAFLSQKAYDVPPMIGTEDGSARAILELTEDGIAIAFRGSDDIAAWLADLDADVVDVDGLGEVHEGFWEAFKLVRDDLLSRSQEETPTIITGHSLGSALALLYAGALCITGRPPKAVFAFEPPRVSIDGTLGELFKSHGVQLNLYRNGLDLVTDIPVALPDIDWQHPSPLIHIGTASLPIPNIHDHMMERVLDAINGLV